MHSRMIRALGAVGAVGASLAFAGPALAKKSPPPNLYVSNSGRDTNANGSTNTCRLQAFPCLTIQHAINEAPTTAAISVAAGNYPEQLVIDAKNLTITGAGSGDNGTVIAPASPLNETMNDPTHPGTEQADIVTFQDTTSGGLSDLQVNGSQATEYDGSVNYVGVFMLDASGTLSGDYITQVQHDSGSFGDQPGANGGVLVANDDSKAHTVTMTSLDVDQYDKNGITCRSIGTTCNISGSNITGSGALDDQAQNGIELYGITAGSVTGTMVQDNIYTSPNYPTSYSNGTGILAINDGKLTIDAGTADTPNTISDNDENIAAIEDQSSYAQGPTQGAWTISDNTIEDATNDSGAAGTTAVPLGDQVGDGIDLTGANKVTVDGNTVTDGADWGIALFGVTNSKIGTTADPNTVTGNGFDGIYLGEYNTGQPSKTNTVAYNTVSDNGDAGIFAAGADSSKDQQATGNTFSHNTLSDNTTYDAEDLSSGKKTAHTANTWTGDTCTPTSDSYPLGLCSGPTG